MRILHITTQKPNSTGSGIYMCGMINGFEKLGYEQSVIAGVDIDDDIKTIKDSLGNVKFYPVIYNTNELNFNVVGMSDSMPYKSTRYRDLDENMVKKLKLSFLNQIEKAIKEYKIDTIICHHLYLLTAFVREVIKDKNIKVLAVCHGTCLRQLKTIPLEREYIKENIKKLDKIFALHEEQRKDIISTFGIESDKVYVIGSGYNDSIFKNIEYTKKENYISLIFAGKICKSKGLLSFINCLDRLNYKKDLLKIKLAGTGSDEKSYNEIVDRAKKSKYDILFLGKLDQKKLSEEFNKADIFVLPSFYEGLPVVILEAMACGTDVITTDIPGVREWIGEKINKSGKIEYVSLPNMQSVGIPKEEDLNDFEDRLSKTIEKMINKNLDKKNHKREIDMSEKTWDGLAKRMEDMIN
ncbi:glycosyltransferase family 4 protein [Peptacetobacter sp.]|uniref:glycosyltransferase family 4 protein n=1 Tax=Peptacetobacter sp. TaxID=2991975 RepID=UPI0026133C9F|nr:glycosyltransferase family 4 protein [Peptacetobacter sp.]